MEKQPAKLNYFFSQGYTDLGATINDFWKKNIESASKQWWDAKGAGWFKKIFYWATALSIYVFGTVWFLALSLLHITILFIVYLVVFFLFSVTWVLDYLYRVKEGIFSVCPNPGCYQKSSLPIYKCSNPKCGVEHTRLVPSKYGIWHRTCECGEKLPCAFFNGREKLPAKCPHCKDTLKSEEGTPLVIPIVGSRNAGKSKYLASLFANIFDQFKEKGYNVSTQSKMLIDSFINEHKGERKGTDNIDQEAIDITISKNSIKYTFYFYDVAGEKYKRIANLKGHQFYDYFSAMLFVLDPFTIERVRDAFYEQSGNYLKSLSPEDRKVYDSSNTLQNVYTNFTENLFQNFHINKEQMIKQSIAVIIPKMDLLTNKIPETDKECRDFLVKYGQSGFIKEITSRFKNLRFFGVVSNIKKSTNIMSPIEWILNRDMKQKWFRRFFGNILMAFFVIVVVGALLLGGFFAYKGISTYIANREYNSYSYEAPAVSLQPYICNTASLNVRAEATTNGLIIGKLTKGQEINIYSIDKTSNFAKIDYNGRIAYVSSDYLTPKNVTEIANNTKTAETTKVAEAVGLTGWSTFQLQGQVDKVIYDDGRYIYFNADGNVVKHNVRDRVRGQTEFEYVYSSPTRFTLKGDANTPYKIACDSNTRQEIWDNTEALGLTFKYDAKGRLITVGEPEYGIGRTETYTYEAGNSYPSKEEIEYYSDDGGGKKESFIFSNYIFDNQGNWTSRYVNHKQVTENEEGKAEKTTANEYSEKRTITYY